MIAHNIIVSFCTFSLLKYDRIFDNNMEHDIYGLKQSPWPNALQAASARFGSWNLGYFSIFMTYLSSYNNIFETETWFFWGNMKFL